MDANNERIPLKSIQFYNSDIIYTIPQSVEEIDEIVRTGALHTTMTSSPDDNQVTNVGYVQDQIITANLKNLYKESEGGYYYKEFANGEKEWISPPFRFSENITSTSGVVIGSMTPIYRTTERWCGQPVYAVGLYKKQMETGNDNTTRFSLKDLGILNSTYQIVDYNVYVHYTVEDTTKDTIIAYARKSPNHTASGTLLVVDYLEPTNIAVKIMDTTTIDPKVAKLIAYVKFVPNVPNYMY